MGACVSVDKNAESAMRFRLSIVSKAKKLVIPSPADEKQLNGANLLLAEEKQMNGQDPLPAVEKQMNGENPIAKTVSQTKTLDSQLAFCSPAPRVESSDFGSKEEAFFDSQAWMESDCEDDFFSVNGDFTPSRGSTPNHQRSVPGSPQFNKAFSFDRVAIPKPQPSPPDKKKKLAELFKESVEREQMEDDQSISSNMNSANGISSKSWQGTPYISGTNSVCSHETTPIRDTKPEKEKRAKSAQCCIPSLVPSLSFNDRKKRMSPGRRSGG